MSTILVVDDNSVNRRLVAGLLSRHRHVLQEAADGAEALEKVKAAPPDLVFTDLLMPNMDGYELIRQLRANPNTARIPIIVYTSLYLASAANKLAQSYGVSDILTRPSKPELIIKAVNAALGLSSSGSDPAETAAQRLAAFLEITRRLASEQDPQRLLEAVCEHLRKTVGAKCAFIGILDESGQRLQRFLASGIEADLARELLLPAVRSVLDRALAERNPLSRHGGKTGPDSVQADRQYSLLVAPILTSKQSYGWVCLVDKLGADAFDEKEEQLVGTLAAQTAIAYENMVLAAELQNRTEQIKREFAAQLESANHEREAFSQFVANEIRAPLREIGSYSQTLIEAHSAKMDEDGRRLSRLIFNRATQTEKLITDMIALSHFGWKELNKTAIDMENLARTVIEDLQKLGLARDLNLTVQALPPACGDYPMIRHALANLVANACKFTRGRPDPAVEIGSRRLDKMTIYYVRDNGAGFDMKRADKLFNLFQRLHRAEEFEGNGIGLAIVRRIIERHDGRVWAESQVDAGATFYFTISEEQTIG